MFNLTLFIEIMPKLLSACRLTIAIAFFSTFIGVTGGTLLALAQRSSIKPLRWLVTAYITLIQGTPMIMQIVFFYFIIKLPFSPIVVAIIAIGLNSCAYISQVIRSGIS